MRLTPAQHGMVIAAVYAAALFLPAAEWTFTGSRLQTGSEADGLPGWHALLVAVAQLPVLWEASSVGESMRAGLSVLSGLTNLILLFALVALIWRSRMLHGRLGGRLEAALWLAAATNSHWFVYLGEEYPVRTALRLGYFVWLGCFVALALAVRAVRRPTARESVAPAV